MTGDTMMYTELVIGDTIPRRIFYRRNVPHDTWRAMKIDIGASPRRLSTIRPQDDGRFKTYFAGYRDSRQKRSGAIAEGTLDRGVNTDMIGPIHFLDRRLREIADAVAHPTEPHDADVSCSRYDSLFK